MTHTATPQDANPENHLIVDDVVSAVTGTLSEDGAEDLRHQLQRAAAEFDRRTADAFGRALLDSLCEDPGNLRQLEALLILGLAHPDVLEAHRISLAVEGRRLAVLLERAGEEERARTVLELLASHMPGERSIDHELAGLMRRSGNTDELVDRYMRRAEEAVADGRVSEAIPWLQEILLIDRTRRDVARMIRDLRYQDAERSALRARRFRLMACVVLVTALVTVLFSRELDIRRSFGELPAAEPGDRDSMKVRQAALEGFLEDNWLWTGFFQATRERDELRSRIAEEERKEAAAAEAFQQEARRVRERAEAARMRGIMYSDRGQFAKALEDFEQALVGMDESWEHHAQVLRDIEALRAHLEEQGR